MIKSVEMDQNAAAAQAETKQKIAPNCPICESNSYVTKYGENAIVVLYECRSCLFAFQSRDEYKNPYESIDYYDPEKQPQESYPLQPTKTDLDRIRTISRILKKGKILEIGGGLGKTSIMAAKLGYDVTITEESRLAVENGIKYHPQLNWVLTSTIPQSVKDQSYDVVMMFHVLEHIVDIKGFLTELMPVFKNTSYFVVEVPNWMSNVRKIKKMDWLYVLDHHPNQFSRKALEELFEEFGFKPMAVEYRRTFAINEKYPVKELLKRMLCKFGFGNVMRITFKREIR